MKERRIGGQLLGSGFNVVTEVPDDIDGGVARVQQKTAQDGVYRMGLELERRDHAEVPASAAKSPEEILVFRGIGGEHFAVGGDYLARQQIVDGHAVLAKQPTDTATRVRPPIPVLGTMPQGPQDRRRAFRGRDRRGSRRPVRERFVWPDPRRPNALGKIDDDAVVAKCAAAHIVAAAADRRQQIVFACEVHSGNDVSDAEQRAMSLGRLLTLAFQIRQASL